MPRSRVLRAAMRLSQFNFVELAGRLVFIWLFAQVDKAHRFLLTLSPLHDNLGRGIGHQLLVTELHSRILVQLVHVRMRRHVSTLSW